MPALIAFRAVQGLGAGAVQPMAITIVGDIYTVAERAKVQGYIASVWAISSVVGPTLGGVFSEFGLLALDLLRQHPAVPAGRCPDRCGTSTRTVAAPEHRIDYPGAALLDQRLTLLILGLLEGGQAWAWGSPASIAVFAGGAVLLVAFVAGRAARRRAGAAAVGVQPPAARDDDAPGARRRRRCSSA